MSYTVTINGNNYSDHDTPSDANDRHLGGQGNRTWFFPLMSDVVQVAGEVQTNTAATLQASASAAVSQSQSAGSAAQAATSAAQAIAGLGAADQSLNLVQLGYGLVGAMAQAAMANRNHDRLLTYVMQDGTATITQAASKEHYRSYASAFVTLPKPYLTTDYQVIVEVESAAPFLGSEGQIIVSARATNGFVLLMTGSATSATIRWKTLHPNAK